jgi:hypothetical protein
MAVSRKFNIIDTLLSDINNHFKHYLQHLKVMKRIIVLLVVLSAIHTSCKESTKDSSSTAVDIAFQELSDDFIMGYLAWRPQTGVYLGLHEYDGKTTNISKASIAEELARLKRFDQKLSTFDVSSLSPGMYYDYRILLNGIQKEIFDFEVMEYFRLNPMIYAGALDVSIYIDRDFAPLEDRLKSIIAIENEASRIFAHAKLNLADSLAEPFIKTAILIANGFVEFLEGDLVLALKDVKNDSLMQEFELANKNASMELKAFAAFLENEKLPMAHSNYALGKEKYKKMLLYQEGILPR